MDNITKCLGEAMKPFHDIASVTNPKYKVRAQNKEETEKWLIEHNSAFFLLS